jgi:VanZ family protein
MNSRRICLNPNWFWPVLVALTVLVTTIVPMPAGVGSIPHLDKVGHMLYLGLIATLLVRFVNPWIVVAVGTAISAGIEIVQYFLPWRTCGMDDAACGIAGTILAVVLYRKVRRYRNLIELRLR